MIERQTNWLGQQRVDIPHLRAMESSVAADFDVLAGKMVAGGGALVVRGFNVIFAGSIGAAATALQVDVAGGIIVHPLASESGSIFEVDPTVSAPEILTSLNPKVTGAFTSNAVNYVGVDLLRSADATTVDTVQFIAANTNVETARSVALARTLDYQFVISDKPFFQNSNVCPIAKVAVDVLGNVTYVQDARNLLFRLGQGADNVDPNYSSPWPDGRTEQTDPYTYDTWVGGDKSLYSLKEWMDAVMTSLKEIKGSTYWYGNTSGVYGNLSIPPASGGVLSLSTVPAQVLFTTTDGSANLTANTTNSWFDSVPPGTYKANINISGILSNSAGNPTSLRVRVYGTTPFTLPTTSYFQYNRYNSGSFIGTDAVSFSGSLTFSFTGLASGLRVQMYTDIGTIDITFTGVSVDIQRVGASF